MNSTDVRHGPSPELPQGGYPPSSAAGDVAPGRQPTLPATMPAESMSSPASPVHDPVGSHHRAGRSATPSCPGFPSAPVIAPRGGWSTDTDDDDDQRPSRRRPPRRGGQRSANRLSLEAMVEASTEMGVDATLLAIRTADRESASHAALSVTFIAPASSRTPHGCALRRRQSAYGGDAGPQGPQLWQDGALALPGFDDVGE